MARYARISGWGKYLPARILTNYELAKTLETSDAWIRSRTGIGERRIASDEETASTMALEASREALKVAGITGEELDLIIVATVTPDHIFPACASLLQHGLGAKHAGAFDLNAACSGFVYSLASASQFIQSGAYRRALVVGSEVYSRILNWSDRSTCVLFGDGAGAVVLESCEYPAGVLSFVLGSDGSEANMLYTHGIAGRHQDTAPNGHPYLVMNGPEVFRFAVTTMAEAARQAVSQASLTLADIDLFIPHQANERIIAAAARSLGLPPEKVFTNVERYGNTSAASIPIAMCEAAQEGRIHDGDKVLVVGFGGGLSWGAAVIQWRP